MHEIRASCTLTPCSMANHSQMLSSVILEELKKKKKEKILKQSVADLIFKIRGDFAVIKEPFPDYILI